MNKCCKGCGVLLQSENPSKIGYVENLVQALLSFSVTF